jgi:hypothetical protein
MRKVPVLTITLVAFGVVVAATASNLSAQAAATYTATATVKTAAGASMTAPVTITVTRWTTDAERAKVMDALKAGGTTLKTTLDAMPATGTIEVGGRKTTLRFARTLSTGGGKLVTIVASEPILHLGAGAPEAKPKAGYDFAFATFEVDAGGKGTAGDLAPAAKLKVGPSDAVVVDDYGAEAVRLTGISSK